jgi:hypothetical protein
LMPARSDWDQAKSFAKGLSTANSFCSGRNRLCQIRTLNCEKLHQSIFAPTPMRLNKW